MARYQETTKEDWIRTIIYVAAFITIIIIGTIFLLPVYWYIWLILVVGCLFLLVRWHAKNFAYRCPNCGHEFEISIFIDFISPHGPGEAGGWKYLKCPKCHKRSRATEIKKKEMMASLRRLRSLCSPRIKVMINEILRLSSQFRNINELVRL